MYTLNCTVLDCIELHSVDKMLTNEVKQEDELKPFIYLKKKKKSGGQLDEPFPDGS